MNGETYRIGDPSPYISIARTYLQQMIPLGNSGYEQQGDDLHQMAGKIPSNRIVAELITPKWEIRMASVAVLVVEGNGLEKER